MTPRGSYGRKAGAHGQEVPTSTPCIGDAASEYGPFDHGWLEIDGAVYDLAVQYPNDDCPWFPVVIGGLHLGGDSPLVLYGTDPKTYGSTAIALDGGVRHAVEQLTLTAYLDGAEEMGVDLWEIITTFGKAFGVKLSKSELRKKYASTRWSVRNSVPVPKEMMRGWSRLH